MTKHFIWLYDTYLTEIISVLNFEFRLLRFAWDLYFGAWNFQYFSKTVTLSVPSNYLFKLRGLYWAHVGMDHITSNSDSAVSPKRISRKWG
jgi:hypothetical protein